MNDPAVLRLEFRIPISPTPSFFAQVRLFDFALRRLGGPYSAAKITVVVGDNCDIDLVRRANAWSESVNVVWKAVPEKIFDEFGIHGTANWRFCIDSSDADVVILSDADTVLLRDIEPLLVGIPLASKAVLAHMAHLPPPSEGAGLPPTSSPEYWPSLFQLFNAPWPSSLNNYSMDRARRYSSIPFYPNLGFVALSRSASESFGLEIFEFERTFKKKVSSHMRCQIAVAILTARLGMHSTALPAPYNAANDSEHMISNCISAADIRVLHYLREGEFNRQKDLLPDAIGGFLERELTNPANIALQMLVREYYEAGR